MPSRKCCGCKRLQSVTPKEWKLISCSSDYVCSADCLVEWLGEIDFDDKSWMIKAIRRDHGPWDDYKSKYESFFAEWLDQNQLYFEYEPWTFSVGKGTYTPDFYLTLHNVFLETKGCWGVGAKTKLKKFRQQWPNVPILVVSWICAGEIYDNACQLRLE